MDATALKTAETKEKIPTKKKRESKPSVKDAAFLTNRELSWLEFNRRVLDEALNDGAPLLERLKFLSIFSGNLDEFFMIRVAGLKERVAEGVDEIFPDGLTATELLAEIRKIVLPMLERQTACLHEDVLPGLAGEGIKIYSQKDLSKAARKKLDEYFTKNVFPVLTPQAVDESHRFPYVSNLSLNVALAVEPDKHIKHGKLEHLYNRRRFVRI